MISDAMWYWARLMRRRPQPLTTEDLGRFENELYRFLNTMSHFTLTLQAKTLERLNQMAVTDAEVLAVVDELKHGWGEVQDLITDLRDQIDQLVADESNGLTADTFAQLKATVDEIESVVPDAATEPAPEPTPTVPDETGADTDANSGDTVSQPSSSPEDLPQTPPVPDPTPLPPPLDNPAPTDAPPAVPAEDVPEDEGSVPEV
jgi:hypothetical protein